MALSTPRNKDEDKDPADKTLAAKSNDPRDTSADSPSPSDSDTDLTDPAEFIPPEYDRMAIDDLRTLAKERGVGVPADVEKAHLVGQLRAYDSGPTAAQSATIGTAAPAPGDAQVADKNTGRG